VGPRPSLDRRLSQPIPPETASRLGAPRVGLADGLDREYGHRFLDALQLPTASWDEPHLKERLCQRTHRLRDEDLAGSRESADPGRDVHGRADEPLARLDRLAGMYPDTDVDTPLQPLGRRGRGPRYSQPTPNGSRDGIEDDVEAVALRPDLGSVEPLDLSADELPVGRQQLDRRRGAVPLHEARVSPEIGEEKAACDRVDPRLVLARHAEERIARRNDRLDPGRRSRRWLPADGPTPVAVRKGAPPDVYRLLPGEAALILGRSRNEEDQPHEGGDPDYDKHPAHGPECSRASGWSPPPMCVSQ
jgi:hypothetical protein